MVEAVGENACLQAVVGIVDARDDVVELAVAREQGDWPERFLTADPGVARHVFQQRGLQHVAVAFATAQQFAARVSRCLDPVVQARGRGFVDHWPNERVRLFRVAGLELAGGCHQTFLQRVVNVVVGIDALHANAALTGLIKRAEHQALHHALQVRSLVGVDDARGIAAQFQHHLLVPGACLEFPAHLAAGERQQFEALVFHQRRGVLAVQGEDRERAARQIGFSQHLANHQRANGRFLRRLQHERAASRNRGRHFVCHQIERKVEWRDERHRTERHPPGVAVIAVQTAGQFQVQGFAIDAHRLLGGDLEGLDQARDLAGGVLDRLARFDAQCFGQFVAAFGKAPGAMLQDRLARPRLEPAHRGRGLHRSGNGLLHHLGIGHGDACRHFAGVLVVYLKHGLRGLWAIGEVVRVGLVEHGFSQRGGRAHSVCGTQCSARVQDHPAGPCRDSSASIADEPAVLRGGHCPPACRG